MRPDSGATTLLLRNLTGLWLLEKAIRQWQAQGKSVTISSLVNDAATVGPIRAAFDVSSELVSSEDVLHGADAMRVHGYDPPRDSC